MKHLIVLLSFSFPSMFSIMSSNGTIQQEALKVLETQCNVCHIHKNPSKVFTIQNMDGFAKQIKRQVFVWKRMPKGKENKLTAEQKQHLKTWLNHQLNNK